MKQYIAHILLIAACCLALNSPQTAFAQTEPADSYTFDSLTAGFRTSGGDYEIDDFFLGAINQSSSDIDIKFELDVSSGTYQFYNGGACPTASSSFTTGPIDLGDREDALQNVFNDITQASTAVAEFEGSATVYSVGLESFYALSPNTFSVSTPSWDGDECSAYYDAWESLNVDIPFYWDGPTSTLIGAYANMYHNDPEWAAGWYTDLSIYNGGDEGVDYGTYFRPAVGYGIGDSDIPEYDPNNSCAETDQYNNFGTEIPAFTHDGPFNLNTALGVNTSDVTHWDGFIFIEPSPVIPGTGPSGHIYPNGSGTSACGSTSCSTVGASSYFGHC